MERRGTAGGKVKKYFWILLRVAIGAMFIYASYYKILSPGSFAHQIYNYKILPPWAINPLALTLPWLQLFCGVALIMNRGALAAAILVTGMLLTFQAALFSALVRDLNISCGCFKTGGSPATWLTFARDFLFVFSAALLTWKLSRKKNASH